jgi:tetratricopeptide (TPR) repeat protein
MTREQVEDALSWAQELQERSQLLLQALPSYSLGDRSEQAVINAYLKVFVEASDDDEADPETRLLLAVAADYLGLYYKNRRFGDAGANRTQALRYIGRAIQLFDRDTHPRDWAIANSNRGNAYCSHLDDSLAPEPDIRSAIRHYKAALEIIEREPVDSLLLADIYDNLVGAYHQLPEGDRLRNLLTAFTYGAKASKAYATAPTAEAAGEELKALGNMVHLTLEIVQLAQTREYVQADDQEGVNISEMRQHALAAGLRAAALLAVMPPQYSMLRTVDRISSLMDRWAREIDPQFYPPALEWRRRALDLLNSLTEIGYSLPQLGCRFRNGLARTAVAAALAGQVINGVDDLIGNAMGYAREVNEPAYLAEALLLQTRHRLQSTALPSDPSALLDDASEALRLLPGDNWEFVDDDFKIFITWLFQGTKVNPGLAKRFRNVIVETLPRWQLGTLGWSQLSWAAISLLLDTLPRTSPAEQVIEVVRSAQMEIDSLAPFFSPLLNRERWASLQIACLILLAQQGTTNPPEDVLRWAEHAFAILLGPFYSEWNISAEAGARSASDAEIWTRPKSVAWMKETLQLEIDLTPIKPKYLLTPQILDTDELNELAQRLDRIWA